MGVEGSSIDEKSFAKPLILTYKINNPLSLPSSSHSHHEGTEAVAVCHQTSLGAVKWGKRTLPLLILSEGADEGR